MTRWLCDTNVWLALAVEDHLHHSVCRRWLASTGTADSISFCRTTQHSLLRLLSNAATLRAHGKPPLTNQEAWEAFERFLVDPRVIVRVDEPLDLQSSWLKFALRTTASTNLWTDAYLAAFAATGGYTMVTTDRAFRQFEGLDLLVLGS